MNQVDGVCLLVGDERVGVARRVESHRRDRLEAPTRLCEPAACCDTRSRIILARSLLQSPSVSGLVRPAG